MIMVGGSVLVFYDDPDTLEIPLTVLETRGYQVIAATDGADALAKLRGAGCQRPCLILLDLMMPGMNGVQFRAEQALDPALASIPVVVLSGDGRAEEQVVVMGLELIKKPVELDVLLATVRRFCAA
jgi:CheY-like chemotaxis protein